MLEVEFARHIYFVFSFNGKSLFLKVECALGCLLHAIFHVFYEAFYLNQIIVF